MSQYKIYSGLDLPNVAKEVLDKWELNKVFEKSISTREGKQPFVFYEGPPSANGLPGIHHVMARAIKDIFCRYKTLKGFQVKRKAGWDTHGLPVELSVEKKLGITKEDIGKKISVDDYNKECRETVMQYTDIWNDLTQKMGYWVDMENPYITYENKYMESVWWLLKKLHSGNNPLKQNLLYKNFSIQPYSPAAGTGLSSHELNQPGCYRDVKDTTVVAQFKVKSNQNFTENLSSLKSHLVEGKEVFFLAWTTTPWTLPSNTALAVGKNIDYVLIRTFNQYTHEPITIIVAKNIAQNHSLWGGGVIYNEFYYQEDCVKSPYQNIIVDWIEKGIKPPTDFNLRNYLNEKTDNGIEIKRPIPRSLFIQEYKGSDLEGIVYDQLMPFNGTKRVENAFRVISDDNDFVTTDDGTGIVHIAPTFGAEDFKIAIKKNIPPMVIQRLNGLLDVPLVDLKGKFVSELEDEIFPFANKYVKEAFYSDDEKIIELKEQQEKLKSIIPKLDKYLSVDELITLKLKKENRAFKIEKYEHSYPHCWRTDKPVLYYPLQSWFIKTTAAKERMIELNKTINWKPESTGSGRFGNWLENLNDWNLSRSRFWGIPLPIWRNTPTHWEKIKIEKCIGSVEELKSGSSYFQTKEINLPETPLLNTPLEISAFIEAKEALVPNFSTNEFLNLCIEKKFLIPVSEEHIKDLHKPYIDKICFIEDGEIAVRESDLIDVWFDSGSMPYAQQHYPFENKEQIDGRGFFPADFIAEGVDQTRGWFFTLHAIATMVFDSVAFKNVISNGLVLDKNGQKMSKRLGNAADPFETLTKYGADATRWYMITNAQPWDNLKFDVEGIAEVQRKFFGTLYNTYGFFALYANLDKFTYAENEVPIAKRPEIDRWIMSKLNSLILAVDGFYADYEPTKAGRAIQEFVNDELSNWYVRLCRRRFWKGDYSEDKIAAYQTLYKCLEVVAQLSASIAPFYMDQLYSDLIAVSGKGNATSVHLSDFPIAQETAIDSDLEERMAIAQQVSSMVLSLRKKEQIKVRQPLQKIMIPILDEKFKRQLAAVEDLILSETNVKEIAYLTDTAGVLIKNIKPNFKTLGPKYGKIMKQIAVAINQFNADDIVCIESTGFKELVIEGQNVLLELADVEILTQDIPGWLVQSEGGITVALDITLTANLKSEGMAREFVNRIQNLRKESGLEVNDKIHLKILQHSEINEAITKNKNYICTETLAGQLDLVNELKQNEGITVELENDVTTIISIEKIN